MPRSEKQADNSRQLTRRMLIGVGGCAVVGAAASSIALRSGWLRGIYLRLAYPEPGSEVVGPMEGALRETLHAAAQTLLGEEPAPDRAIRMLENRASELKGHLALQRSFASWLDEQTRRSGAESFRAATRDAQFDLLESCMRFRTHNDIRRAWYGAVFRDRVLWDRQVLQPMLKLYSHSDAWLDLGYDSFPGDPSGLDSYREAPLATSAFSATEDRP